MLRIHADGSASASSRGFSTLYPALHRGWTDDIYGLEPPRRARRPARDRGRDRAPATSASSARSDLTGFNWANVPAILVETGFMTNPAERRLLQSGSVPVEGRARPHQGVAAFTPPT